MSQPKEKFLVDDKGQKVAVVLDIQEYEKLIDERKRPINGIFTRVRPYAT